AVAAELAAQLLDVGVDGPCRHDGADRALDEFLTAEGTTGLGEQCGHQLKLSAGDDDFPLADPQRVSMGQQHELAGGIAGGRHWRGEFHGDPSFTDKWLGRYTLSPRTSPNVGEVGVKN